MVNFGIKIQGMNSKEEAQRVWLLEEGGLKSRQLPFRAARLAGWAINDRANI